MATLRQAPMALLLLVVSCGTALVDNAYRGVPKFRIHGRVNGAEGADVPAPTPGSGRSRLGLFWLTKDFHQATTMEDLVEQPSNSLPVTLPGDLIWSLYDNPEAKHFSALGGGSLFALGFPFVYLDRSGNTQWDEGESFVADTSQLAIVFAARDLTAQESPTGVPIPAGYHTISLPIQCGPTRPPVTDQRDCGVPLGAGCSADADCGTIGVCLSTKPFPWQGGYCAIEDESPDTCHPEGGVLFDVPPSPQGGEPMRLWVQACQSDADCRMRPPDDSTSSLEAGSSNELGPWHCDFTFGACLPTAKMELKNETASLHPICPQRPDGMMPPMP